MSTDPRAELPRSLLRYEGRTVADIARDLGLKQPETSTEAQTFHVRVLNALIEESGLNSWLQSEGITVKTVRLRDDGTPLEKMTFRNFSHEALPSETWETGDLRRETKHLLLVVFDGNERGSAIEENRLRNVFFWSPSPDEERRIAADWRRCREAVAYGMEPPKEKDTDAVHVGTKGRDASDLETTSTGTTHKKLCLCFNKKFVAEIIERYSAQA